MDKDHVDMSILTQERERNSFTDETIFPDIINNSVI